MIFSKDWLAEAHRVFKNPPEACLWRAACITSARLLSAPNSWDSNKNNIITWRKPNAMPNITKRTFTHTTEYTCWFVKGGGWVFNYFHLKKINPLKAKNGQDKQMPDFMELPIVQGAERLRDEKKRTRHTPPHKKPERLLEIFIAANNNPQRYCIGSFHRQRHNRGSVGTA